MAEEQKPFEFYREYDGTLSQDSAVFQALGAASICWDPFPQGVFDSDRAKIIGDALLVEIQNHTARPQLGYATTEQLLEEIKVRIAMDYYQGGGGLDYSTVRGRPESVLERLHEAAIDPQTNSEVDPDGH